MKVLEPELVFNFKKTDYPHFKQALFSLTPSPFVILVLHDGLELNSNFLFFFNLTSKMYKCTSVHKNMHKCSIIHILCRETIGSEDDFSS